MNFFVWTAYLPGDKYAYCEKMKGIDNANIIDLLSGVRLDEGSKFVAEKFSKGSIGDVFGCGAGIVVADKVKLLLENSNIQFLQVGIPPSDLVYWMANFLVIQDAIDKKKSRITMYEPGTNDIEKIEKLILLPGLSPSVEVFRLEGRPDVVIVTESLKNKLQKISPSVGKFIAVEKFKIGYF